MADKDITTHYGQQELEDYFIGALTREETVALEEHLLSCETCGDLAKQIQASWSAEEEEMSPRAHGQAYLRDCVRQGLLAALPTLASQARAGFEVWMRQQEGRLAGAVRVVHRAKDTVLDAGDALANLLLPDPLYPALAHAGAIRVRGAVRTRGGAPSASGNVVVLGKSGGPAADVSMDGQELVVRFHDIAENGRPPLVFVIPVAEPERTRRIETRWSREDQVWSAREPELPPDFVVAITPAL